MHTLTLFKKDGITMKIKLFTHTDLDGVGCAIILKMYIEDVDAEFCSVSNINERVKEWLEQDCREEYTHLFVTDISVNEEIAKELNSLFVDKKIKINLLDHHETASWLNQYEWARVESETNGVQNSGTDLLYKFLIKEMNFMPNELYSEFVELVRSYDTWNWFLTDNQKAKGLSDLCGIQGLDAFEENMIEKLKIGVIFSPEDEKSIELEKEKRKIYFKRKKSKLIKLELHRYKVGAVFAEQYISELGNILAQENEELDFIAIFTGKRVSFRTVKDNINLGEFCKEHYGGGGHDKAAGMEVSNEILEKIFKIILNAP